MLAQAWRCAAMLHQLRKALADGAKNKAIPVLAVGGVGLVGMSYFANNLIFNVEAGSRAVKFSRLSGIGNQVYPEGTHVQIPWFEWPIIFNVQTRAKVMTSTSGTKDLQMVKIDLRTLSRPHPDKIGDIYRKLGNRDDYEDVVLSSMTNEVSKSVIARVNAQALISQRGQISAMIKRELSERLLKFNIILDEVAITHLEFSPDFKAAVESKQVAKEQADRAKFLVIKAEQEKNATIIRAEATTKEAELIGEAMKVNPEAYIDIRRIQRAAEISKAIAASPNRVVLSAETLLLNLMGDHREKMESGATHIGKK
jgi:prohibitin 2